MKRCPRWAPFALALVAVTGAWAAPVQQNPFRQKVAPRMVALPADPASRPGPADGDVAGSRVKVSGDTRVSLVTDPRSILIGRPAEIEFRIEDLSAGGETVRGATVRAWVAKVGERAGRSSPVHFTSETGTYGVQHTFDSAADYHLTVGVLTETGDAFKVEFILPVVASAAEGEGRATGSEPGGRPGGRPIDTGSGSPAPRGRPRGGTPAADRAHVEVTAEGFIEVEWRATDPPVNAVTFALLDATGRTLETRRVTAAPFATRFPRPADAYFSDGLTHVQVSAEHAGGLKAEVVVPVRKTLPRQDDPTVKPAWLAGITDLSDFYHEFCAALARQGDPTVKPAWLTAMTEWITFYDEFSAARARRDAPR